MLVIIFWNFTLFQDRCDSPQVKGSEVSSRANLVHELSHMLRKDSPEDLRNQEILQKSQIWVATQPSAEPATQKLKQISDIKLSLSCPALLDFSALLQILCPGLRANSSMQNSVVMFTLLAVLDWKSPFGANFVLKIKTVSFI